MQHSPPTCTVVDLLAAIFQYATHITLARFLALRIKCWPNLDFAHLDVQNTFLCWQNSWMSWTSLLCRPVLPDKQASLALLKGICGSIAIKILLMQRNSIILGGTKQLPQARGNPSRSSQAHETGREVCTLPLHSHLNEVTQRPQELVRKCTGERVSFSQCRATAAAPRPLRPCPAAEAQREGTCTNAEIKK